MSDEILMRFQYRELFDCIVEPDDKYKKVNRSFRVFNDFIIKGCFCFFRPFAKVMFEEMVDDPSNNERKNK